MTAAKTKSYKTTYVACMLGTINQAVIAGITAILFVYFMQLYGLQLWQLGVLIGVNFASQLAADLVLSAIIDRISFRITCILASSLSVVGLAFFALTPQLAFVIDNGLVYACMIISTVIFSAAGGMNEVLISPIADAIPHEEGKGGAAMALMHSYYAWGQALMIIITSLFILACGAKSWYIITLAWMIIPIADIVLFAICPLEQKRTQGGGKTKGKLALSPFMIVAMLAIFLGGGVEIIMNQYVSTFATLSLGFSKVVSDLVGMCLFAVMLGVGRTIYGFMGARLDMHKVLTFGALACFICYLIVGLVPQQTVVLIACVVCGLTCSLLWPGTLVVAGDRFPQGGAWVFAVLAISGDLGASIFPTAVGFISDKIGLTTSFIISAIVPLCCFICHAYLWRSDNKLKLLNAQIK